MQYLDSHYICCISVQFQNIALCKERGKDQPVILTDEWPNFSCTAVFQPWTSTLCFPTRFEVAVIPYLFRYVAIAI